MSTVGLQAVSYSTLVPMWRMLKVSCFSRSRMQAPPPLQPQLWPSHPLWWWDCLSLPSFPTSPPTTESLYFLTIPALLLAIMWWTLVIPLTRRSIMPMALGSWLLHVPTPPQCTLPWLGCLARCWPHFNLLILHN